MSIEGQSDYCILQNSLFMLLITMLQNDYVRTPIPHCKQCQYECVRH